MTSMPMLLRLALAFCPAEFRREYGAQIAADVAQRRLSTLAAAVDVLFQGIILRLDGLRGHTAYAVRSLRRTPLYALVVIVTIATVIAANVAVFSILENVLFKPLPYPNSDRIIWVPNGTHDAYFSYLSGHDAGAMATSFEQFGMNAKGSAMLTLPSGSTNLRGFLIDPGYFEVLGMQPELGRTFTSDDMQARFAIISDRVWRRYFGASPTVIGRRVLIDGYTTTIVGVAPAAFHDVNVGGLSNSDLWLCIRKDEQLYKNRGWSAFHAWALLKPGVSIESGQTDVVRVVETLRQRYPHEYVTWQLPRATSAVTAVAGAARPMLYTMYGAVLVLLVIACANIINMALARMAARERELTLRTALGATRRDLAAQLGVEIGLLATVGAVLGIGLGEVALRLFAPFVHDILPRWEDVHVDALAVLDVVVVLVLALVAATLIPAATLRTDLAGALKGASTSSSARRMVNFRSLLVSIEVALALVVVLSAALIVRSFIILTQVPLGFSPTHVYLADAPTLLPSRYKTPESVVQADTVLQSAMTSIPGVQATSCSMFSPFKDFSTTLFQHVAGGTRYEVGFNIVCDSYFGLLHVPLLAGRFFGSSETLNSPEMALVDRGFAAQYFGSVQHAIGQRILVGVSKRPGEDEWRTIVGVVDETRQDLSAPPNPTVYLAQSQFGFGSIGYYLVRTGGADDGIVTAVQRAYHTVDPFFPIPTVTPMQQSIDASAANTRLAASLFIAFSIIALVLALAGIYSVTAFSVAQRTREFGIRKAIGATSADVVGAVVRRALRQALVGIVLGLVLAAVTVRFLASLLYQTSPFDTIAISSAIAILLACTLLAAAVPALSAMRIEPAITLRYE
jgi:putative ABC transport system permease protein